jgi:hypothetical protein
VIDLESLVRLAGEHAETILIKRHEQDLVATYLLFRPTADGGLDIDIVPCLWRNEIEKQLMLLEVKKLARERGAVALSFVAECWLATRTKDNPRRDLPASEDPQRREVVMAAATDGKAKAIGSWQIVRDKPGGRIMALVEDFSPAAVDGTFEGRMIDGILPG